MNLLTRILAGTSVFTVFVSAAAQHLDCYVQLIRATDSPEPITVAASEIGPLLSQKLRPIFKWKYYFVKQQEKITLQKNKPTKVRFHNGTRLEVRWGLDDLIEVSLEAGKTQTRKAHRNHPELMIIEGVQSQNSEPWFVVIRRNKPLNPNPDTAAK